ncbi:MAG: hypothetical protein ACOC8B_05250, partial [Gemmatimonadota bacterium]
AGAGDDAGSAAGAASGADAPQRAIRQMQGAAQMLATLQEIHYSQGNGRYTSDLDELERWEDPEELEVYVVRATPNGWTALFIDRESGATCGMSYGAGTPVGWPGGMPICQR